MSKCQHLSSAGECFMSSSSLQVVFDVDKKVWGNIRPKLNIINNQSRTQLHTKLRGCSMSTVVQQCEQEPKYIALTSSCAVWSHDIVAHLILGSLLCTHLHKHTSSLTAHAWHGMTVACKGWYWLCDILLGWVGRSGL